MASPNSSIHSPRVVPAHVSYFAIYNPSLGQTDETVRDQIVYYYSAKSEEEVERRRRERVTSRKQQISESKDSGQPSRDTKDDEEAEENERLRQIGLAQGMVDFVNNFSNGVPLEVIETEKSRVVLKEIEPQWWILASISLTKLPAATASSTSSGTRKASNLAKDTRAATAPSSAEEVEYSSREVAPAQLLLAQLSQAYQGFLLHHASSLGELWKKHENKRELFCGLLNRYWTQFIANWDVLLHGNPAVELYDAVKLAVGGELGIGVGEEEWGSGEREVLEGFASRTEGLLDLIVGRYGDAPFSPADGKSLTDIRSSRSLNSSDPEPWLGNGEDPRAEDGIIFSGVGGISRRSLITVSQWMANIYVHGESAYGVGENPASRPRHRRNRRHPTRRERTDATTGRTQHHQQLEEVHPRLRSPKSRAPDLRRKAIENNATPPGIPAPIVSAVERSLEAATTKADPNNADTKGEGGEPDNKGRDQSEQGSALFRTEKVMKYLSLGYGSSWTLNPKGFGPNKSTPNGNVNTNTTESQQPGDETEQNTSAEEPQPLQELDPTLNVSDTEETQPQTPFVQRLEQSIGKFLIGLSGDLENTEFENESDGEATPDTKTKRSLGSNSPTPNTSSRIFLRTLTIEMSSSRFSNTNRSAASQNTRRSSVDDSASSTPAKTSAAASVDGSRPNVTHEKVQVAVYIHQPFIFVFLFQLHTPNLTMPGFYRSIHHILGPLQKSLLRSTDPQRWRERVQTALVPDADQSLGNGGDDVVRSIKGYYMDLYDLVYDPSKLTVRTSIPNIPLPGSLAAEGLERTFSSHAKPVTVSGSWYTLGIPIGLSTSSSSVGDSVSSNASGMLMRSNWTRVEALNIHTHILNIWVGTRPKRPGVGSGGPGTQELERTVKTARGWWVVWMKVPVGRGVSVDHDARSDEVSEIRQESANLREAILVRRSPQDNNRAVSGKDLSSSVPGLGFGGVGAGKWLLRDQPRSRDVSGSSGSGATTTTNAKGVSEGVGVDARKWVEGLVKLTM
ncbi:hypothetical protein ABEF95_000433 [Exophiala dermatitidis]